MELLVANFAIDHSHEVVMFLEEEVVFNFCCLLTDMAIFLAEKLSQSLSTLVPQPHWIYVVLAQRIEEAFAFLGRITRSF